MDEMQEFVLKSSVTFVFSQLGAIAKGWQERRKQARQGGIEPEQGVLQIPATKSEALEGALSGDEISAQKVADVFKDLKALRGALLPYQDEDAMVDRDDREDAIKLVEQGRSLLMDLYQQEVTFVGETDRPVTGTPLSIVDQRQYEIQAGDGSAVVTGHNTGSITINNRT